MVRFATASLASGIAFGVISQVHARRGAGRLVPRWLHQTSFTSSLVLLGISAWSTRRTSVPAAIADGAALGVLSTLPFTSAGRPNHIGVASVASVLHAIGVYVSRRSAAPHADDRDHAVPTATQSQ